MRIVGHPIYRLVNETLVYLATKSYQPYWNERERFCGVLTESTHVKHFDRLNCTASCSCVRKCARARKETLIS